ncbi:hypothetical protein ACFQ1L_06945 [Phytohabitans flavus]|uniref:hypothetical protein n=1 Tax=Phytohabitans flavus TaxID=1076124 RepID=UPI00363B321B
MGRLGLGADRAGRPGAADRQLPGRRLDHPAARGRAAGARAAGEGCIELRRFREAVDAAGYTGPVEVEVFHADLWARPGAEILADTIAAYEAHVA